MEAPRQSGETWLDGAGWRLYTSPLLTLNIEGSDTHDVTVPAGYDEATLMVFVKDNKQSSGNISYFLYQRSRRKGISYGCYHATGTFALAADAEAVGTATLNTKVHLATDCLRVKLSNVLEPEANEVLQGVIQILFTKRTPVAVLTAPAAVTL
jgi:hypothetical protein